MTGAERQARYRAAHALDARLIRSALNEIVSALEVLHRRLAKIEERREQQGKRISKTKRDQKRQGLYLGGIPPWGYRVVEDEAGGHLEPIARLQAAVRRMQQLRAQGMALRPIAATMRQSGIKISHLGVQSALRAAGSIEIAQDAAAVSLAFVGRGTWLTKRELAEARQISVRWATRLIRKQGWCKQTGVDGRIRVLVPHEWLTNRKGAA